MVISIVCILIALVILYVLVHCMVDCIRLGSIGLGFVCMALITVCMIFIVKIAVDMLN